MHESLFKPSQNSIYLAGRIYDGATVLGKVFKVSRRITGKYKISISVAPYMLKFDSDNKNA